MSLSPSGFLFVKEQGLADRGIYGRTTEKVQCHGAIILKTQLWQNQWAMGIHHFLGIK